MQSSYHNLHTLKDVRPKLPKAITSNCNRELVISIGECALNVLRVNVKLSDLQKRRFKKFRGQLRSVAGKHVPLARKKRIIHQRGGFLFHLLSAVLPTLASAIYNKLNSS